MPEITRKTFGLDFTGRKYFTKFCRFNRMKETINLINMKKVQLCFFGILLLAFTSPAFSQIVSKTQPKPADNRKLPKDSQLPVDFSTSREEDIFVFENNMKMFQKAVDYKSEQEAEKSLQKNLAITAREIARAKNNLAELKAGNTKHLEEWRKENNISEPLNISMEINRLTDNINSMEYRYKNLNSANLNTISDSRTSAVWITDMKVILKNMNKNLKYESDKKIIHVEQPTANDTLSAGGNGIITQNQPGKESENGSPMMDDFHAAQKAKSSQIAEEKSNYQNQLQANDYKSARRTYKSILQIMQSEIDANIWLKAQKDEESNKMATINIDEVSPVIAEQQKILDEAGKIKVPASPSDDFNLSESLELITKFEKTIK
jgi:hypothetical protein